MHINLSVLRQSSFVESGLVTTQNLVLFFYSSFLGRMVVICLQFPLTKSNVNSWKNSYKLDILLKSYYYGGRYDIT